MAASRARLCCCKGASWTASIGAATSAQRAAERPCASHRRRQNSKLEILHDELRVPDGRRLREAVPDKLAPLLEIGRAAKIDGVVLQRLPLNEKPIPARPFDRAL